MRCGLFGIFLVWAIVALADDDGERAALARVIHEIDALKPLIAEAEAQANPDARIKLHYPWLKQDLEYVKLGIREHIETPRSEPRSFPPLKGDYRRQALLMALNAAASNAFVHGSGVSVNTLQLAVVSVFAVAVLLWLAWIAFALWRDWHDSGMSLMAMQWGLMRAAVLSLLLIFLIR